jgi:hypothetical protein
MTLMTETDLSGLRHKLLQLRGSSASPPDASIVVPVNAQGDLWLAFNLLDDVIRYGGEYTVEVVLVINNYPPENPPQEIEQFRELGMQIVAVPSARRPDEVVIISARALGVRAAGSEITIHFDADCRVPDIDAYLNWAVESLKSGAKLAYSHVSFYDERKHPSVHTKIAVHHTMRWLKRNLLRIPTTRGSNFVIDRSLFLLLYDAGKLAVDLQVGPAAKLEGAKIIYSGRRSLAVFTSGRRFQVGWLRILRYMRYRFHYNLNAIPSRWRQVTRTSWKGFEQESERRKHLQ